MTRNVATMEALDFVVKVCTPSRALRGLPRAAPHRILASPLHARASQPTTEFARDSIRLIKRCTKPDRSGEPRAPASALVSLARARARRAHDHTRTHHAL